MKQSSFFYRVKKDWMRNRSLYLMIIPVLIFFILFHYKPMYGAIIAFKDYTLGRLGQFYTFFQQCIFWTSDPQYNPVKLLQPAFWIPSPNYTGSLIE